MTINLHNIEAEEAILGGILVDPEAIGRVAEMLKPESFTLRSHQAIFEASLTLHSQGKPTDLMTVTTWLSDQKLLEKAGGQLKLVQLIGGTVSATNIDQYGLLISDKKTRRELIKSANQIIELAKDTSQDLETILQKSEEQIASISQVRSQQDLIPISETLIDTFQEIEDRSTGAIPPGIPCGFYDLDVMTGGFQRSDLIIVAGRPSMGKSSLAVNFGYAIAKKGLAVAIFSLEMSKGQLVQRMLSSEAKIETNRIRSGQIRESEWEPLTEAISNLAELPIYIDDSSNPTVSEMRSKVRKMQAENGGKLGLILIDYLQLMEGGSDNRVQELSRITRGLKGLAKELDVPVIALSQLSRSVEQRTNKRPILSDLRESGSVEQDADLVMMIYRDDYYNPDTSDRGIAEIILAKHRNGPTGTVKLLFDNQFTQFKNLARSN
ncbi:MAG: replicative DNA helicase [Planktothrix sp.]|uniref:replicative DNA helicase n=3 Tax=Planktothrix sp. TaxID=3088171 RepID=UPI0038D3DAD1